MGSSTFGDDVPGLPGTTPPQQHETDRGAVAREGIVGRA